MTTAKKPRGFAAMHPDHVKATARKGGKAAHAAGTAHEFTSDEARRAGAKGGKAAHAKRRLAKASGIDGSSAPKGERVVDVGCSSASGCVGTVKAGTPEAAEAIGKPYVEGSKGASGDDTAIADGSSADENPDEMGSCGGSGCGSHKG
jgi:uncharacterized protein